VTARRAGIEKEIKKAVGASKSAGSKKSGGSPEKKAAKRLLK
jgi:hypothetical protein